MENPTLQIKTINKSTMRVSQHSWRVWFSVPRSWTLFGMDDDAILCDCSSSSIVLCDLQHAHNTMILLAVYTGWMWCEHDVNALKEDQLTLLFAALMGIVEPWSCQPNKEAIPALPRHWVGIQRRRGGDQI